GRALGQRQWSFLAARRDQAASQQQGQRAQQGERNHRCGFRGRARYTVRASNHRSIVSTVPAPTSHASPTTRHEPGGAPALSDSEFHARAKGVLSAIEAALDRGLQDDEIDIDSQRTGGLLELVFPSGSKIVVNTQPPLHELWLAARTGGYHFRLVDG